MSDATTCAAFSVSDTDELRVIEAIQVEKRYGRKLAVHSASFCVERGEVVGLIGPNGAGKTTIMRILTGFLPPSSGTARIAGFDVTQAPLEVKKRIGYLPELPPLYPEMTVREFLLFAAGIKLVPRRDRMAAVNQAIERCTLSEMSERRIEHLSKGYRQRVGIAQAIVHRPQVVILDEPTSGLDPQQVIEVRNLVGELAETMTVLISSHILSEIDTICGRVIVISRGNLLAAERTEALKERLHTGGQIILVEFGGDAETVLSSLRERPFVNRIEDLESTDGQAEVCCCRLHCEGSADHRNEVARAVIDVGGDLLSLRQERVSLEDAFLELTKEE